jgi:DNA-binding NtrC family response regulator
MAANTDKRVFLVDEEMNPANYYIRALEECGMEPKQFRDVDSAFDAIVMNQPPLVILDVMMPPGRRYADADTSEGIFTGVLFFRDVRERFPSLRVIVLTNLQDLTPFQPWVLDANLKIARKCDYGPLHLAELAGSFGGFGIVAP